MLINCNVPPCKTKNPKSIAVLVSKIFVFFLFHFHSCYCCPQQIHCHCASFVAHYHHLLLLHRYYSLSHSCSSGSMALRYSLWFATTMTIISDQIPRATAVAVIAGATLLRVSTVPRPNATKLSRDKTGHDKQQRS